MSIIVKIHLFRGQNQGLQKYLLTFIQDVHYTVKHFLQFAVNALQIKSKVEDLIVEIDGYTIPHCLQGKIIINSGILIIKSKSNKLLVQNSKSGIQMIEQIKNSDFAEKQLNEFEQMIQEQNSQQSTPKFSQKCYQSKQKKVNGKSKNKNKPIEAQQQKPKKSKNKKQIHQSSEKEQNSVSQEQEQKVSKKHKKSKRQKIKEKPIPLSQLLSESEEQLIVNIKSHKESSSSQQEDLPRITKSKKQKKIQKVQTKKNQQKKLASLLKMPKLLSFAQEISVFQQKKELKDKKELKEKIELKDKKQRQQQIVRQNKQVTVKQNKQVVSFPKPIVTKIPLQKLTKNIERKAQYYKKQKITICQDIQSSQQSSQVIKKPTSISIPNPKPTKPIMLPVSLRPKATFKSHLQSLWITITKQQIEKYQKESQTTFIKQNNLIKFKEIQLDQERFVPKLSQWIQATVTNVNKEKITLAKVTQLGKDYRHKYQICDFNMVQLQINTNFATQQQLLFVKPNNQSNNNTNELSKPFNQSIKQTLIKQSQFLNQSKVLNKLQVSNQTQVLKSSQVLQEQVLAVSEQQKKDRCSLQKFICGQVNFYFSDKQYPMDLPLKMHANKNPGKYVSLRFLLNCPKIKKVLKDQEKLFYILMQDQKRQERNFQIDQHTRMVRKKLNCQNIRKQQQKQQELLEQHKVEQQI